MKKTLTVVIIFVVALAAIFALFIKGLRSRHIGGGTFSIYDNGMKVGEYKLDPKAIPGALTKIAEKKRYIYIGENRNEGKGAMIYKIKIADNKLLPKGTATFAQLPVGTVVDTTYIGESKGGKTVASGGGTIPVDTSELGGAGFRSSGGGCKCGGGCDGCGSNEAIKSYFGK